MPSPSAMAPEPDPSGSPEEPSSEPTPPTPGTSPTATPRPREYKPGDDEVPPPGPGEDPADPADPATPADPTEAPAPEPPAPDPDIVPEPDGEAGRGRPAMEPAVPVKDASELDASNAGSLSGTRRGNVVSLILPSDKAKKGDWVAIFLFPEESTPGWTQVDADNSVSIDVSNLSEGSYQLAVGDRESRLLGWAQLEITTAAANTSEPAQMTVETTTPHESRAPERHDWMLASAGGLLLVGAGSLLILARPALIGLKR